MGAASSGHGGARDHHSTSQVCPGATSFPRRMDAICLLSSTARSKLSLHSGWLPPIRAAGFPHAAGRPRRIALCSQRRYSRQHLRSSFLSGNTRFGDRSRIDGRWHLPSEVEPTSRLSFRKATEIDANVPVVWLSSARNSGNAGLSGANAGGFPKKICRRQVHLAQPGDKVKTVPPRSGLGNAPSNQQGSQVHFQIVAPSSPAPDRQTFTCSSDAAPSPPNLETAGFWQRPSGSLLNGSG